MADKCNCGCNDAVTADEVHEFDANIEALKRRNELLKQIVSEKSLPLRDTNTAQINTRMTADGADLDIADIITDYVDEYKTFLERRRSLITEDDTGANTDALALLQELMNTRTDLLVEKILRRSTQPCSDMEVRLLVSNFNADINNYWTNINEIASHTSDEDFQESMSMLNESYGECTTSLMVYKVSGLTR